MTPGSGTVGGDDPQRAHDPSQQAPRGAPELELTLVTMVFDASDGDRLAALLSRYVVTTRNVAGCRNIDLCASVGTPDRFVVIEKWDSPVAHLAHFDSAANEAFAVSVGPVLSRAPQVELLESISAHDLA